MIRPAGGRAAVAVAAVLAVPALLSPSAVAAPPGELTIPEIHGDTFRSPYDGKQVRGVPGVVTAVSDAGQARGFWMQHTGEDDPRASSGLFVFTRDVTPDVRPGDEVLVSGTVDDYYPDAPPEQSVLLPLTELVSPQWTVVSSGNPLPEPVRLRADTVPEKLAAQPGGSIVDNTLRPERFALDYFKSHESELVSVDDARVVGPTNDFGELFVTTKPAQNPTARGGTRYAGYDQPNTGRLLLGALPRENAPELPKADVGDTLRGATTGPLGYSEFGGYQLRATRFGERVDGGVEPEVTRAQRRAELSVATFNVENLSAVNEPAKFAKLAEGVARNLASPDIVSLEEIQDNNGEAGGGVVAADETLRRFTDAIVAAGGPRYRWRQIDPEFDADGGAPNANIRVAFLFNPKRVSFVDRPGGDATTATQVRRAGFLRAQLSVSPGRIAPENEAWQESRKPLVGEFAFRGKKVFVIGNHFNSKGGDAPLFGAVQPPERMSEQQRLRQAALVHDFAGRIQRANPLANVVALGDFNDFEFSPTLRTLTAGGVLRNQIDTLPPAQRYSYVFQGNAQVLDHTLTSRAVLFSDYDVVHTNAEFSDQASDHDPQVLRFVPLF